MTKLVIDGWWRKHVARGFPMERLPCVTLRHLSYCSWISLFPFGLICHWNMANEHRTTCSTVNWNLLSLSITCKLLWYTQRMNRMTQRHQKSVTSSQHHTHSTLITKLYKNLSFAQLISSISKSCFLNICDLRCILNTIDQTTACTITTSLIHFKIDYCNSLLLDLPAT